MYSVQVAVSDGTLAAIALSIQYFERDDITLYRNLDTTPLVLGTDWQWDTDTTVRLLTNVPVPAGDYITVRRNTNIDRAFNIYDGGAAFSRETLDENFKQMIYLAQEFTEGNGLTGVFFPLDMHGFRITNLGDGVDPKDAVNKGQLDVVDDRVAAIENSFVTATVSYPWYRITTGTEDTFSPPFEFTKAVVVLNGVYQTPEYSYVVVNNQILLAEPVEAGTMVFARLGEDIGLDPDFATVTQLAAEVQARQAADALLQGNLDTEESERTSADTTLQNSLNAESLARTNADTALSNNKADKGDAGITQLGGTTVGSAVFKATTQAAGRTALGLGGAAILNVGTTAGTVADGLVVKGLTDKVRKKMEVYYSGLSLAIPTSSTNFVNLIKTLTPTSGALNSFFNTTTNKLNVYNDNSSVFFKVNITGTWTTTSSNRSMIMGFTGTNGNTLTVTRVENTSPDVIQFNTYFSVDASGNMVTNGAPITIQSNGSVFTATSILVTVEQVTNVAVITPV